MTVREAFEKWWSEKYSFEMKRGVGRTSRNLKRDNDDNYISDLAREGYEIWKAAMEYKL